MSHRPAVSGLGNENEFVRSLSPAPTESWARALCPLPANRITAARACAVWLNRLPAIFRGLSQRRVSGKQAN